MKKNFRTMLATIIALALVLTMAVPAFAVAPYEIIKQPTKDDPTVEVSDPQDVYSYQWYKKIGSAATKFTPDSEFFTGYCCGRYSGTANTWYSYSYLDANCAYHLDVGFYLNFTGKLKITLTSDAADFDADIVEYTGTGDYVSVGANTWVFHGSDQDLFNPEIYATAPFTATYEFITDSGTYSLTYTTNEILYDYLIYDGSYDSSISAWSPIYQGTSVYPNDNIDFYVDGVFPGMILKFTPDNYSSEASFEVASNNNSGYCRTYTEGNSYYIEFTDGATTYDNIYFNCYTLTESAAFTADIEILSATGNMLLPDQITETLTEHEAGASYFCEITYYDGTVLTTDTVSYGAGGAYAGMFMVLLLKKAQAAEAEQPEDTTTDTEVEVEQEVTEEPTEEPEDTTEAEDTAEATE